MKSLTTLVLALFLGSSVNVLATEAPKKEEAKAAPAKKEEHKKVEAKPAAAPVKKEEAKPAAAPVKKEEVKPAAK